MLSRIVAKNFQSWSELVFDFKKGVTLIDGWNEDDQTSEGSGKSSILNAMAWCIYGKIPKEANVDDVIKYGEKSCSVSLIFQNGESIERTRKPNDLYIMNSKGEIYKGKDAKETQEAIEEYVGCNFETFCQSVYFAQNYPKKFLTSNQEDRGKILSGIQNLQVFDKGRKEVMELLKKETETIQGFSKQIELEENTNRHLLHQVQMITDFIKSKQDSFEKSKIDIQKKIDYAQSEIYSLERTQKDLQEKWGVLSQELGGVPESKEDELDLLRKSYSEVTHLKQQLHGHNSAVKQANQKKIQLNDRHFKLNEKGKKLAEFIKNPSRNCPSCGTALTNADTSHSIKELEEICVELSYIEQDLVNTDQFLVSNKIEDMKDLEAREASIRGNINRIEQFKQELKRREKDVETLKYNMTAVEVNLSAKKLEHSRFELELMEIKPPSIEKEQKDREALAQQLKKSNDTVIHLRNLKQVSQEYAGRLEQLKDGFKEIKTYVFNNALHELNFRANKYLHDLFQVSAALKFTTEEQKIQVSISLDGQTTSLGLLSGGQERRFHLAVDLALSDIVSHRKSSKIDLLVLDEYFKDLSEVSMEKCLDLLKARKSPVMIIEHNTIFKNIVDNTFMVRLENGTTNGQ